MDLFSRPCQQASNRAVSHGILAVDGRGQASSEVLTDSSIHVQGREDGIQHAAQV